MPTTCHSEYGSLKLIYIKRAADAFVSEAQLKSQWGDLNYLEKPDFDQSALQYEHFEKQISENASELRRFPHSADVGLDSIYCRDSSIATDFGMIICSMGKHGRIPEPEASKSAYLRDNVNILGIIQTPGTLEGGDVAWLDQKTLAVGLSYRTNEEGIQQLTHLLEPFNINVITVFLPHYQGKSDVFHLMSILSPIDKNLAVVYSPLMPINFRNELLNRGFELIEVPEEEFDSMGANVLAVAPRECLIVKGNPITRDRLMKTGCKVIEYEGSEISVKGGGGPTCLTRPIWREI